MPLAHSRRHVTPPAIRELSDITADSAARLAAQYWQIQAQASVLPSYADRNFRLQTAERSYVLKIANSQTSATELELENAALRHLELRCPELQLPRVIASPLHPQSNLLPFYLADGRRCQMRVFSYIEGSTYADFIADVAVTDTTTRQRLHQSLGACLAQIGLGLTDFDHEAAGRDLQWNLCHLPRLAEETGNLDDAVLRTLVGKHMAAFMQQLPHWQNTLPSAIIHNDANDFNVIVDAAQGRVAAIIDYGDLCRSLRIADLAIACVYAMQHEANLLACCCNMLRGYHQIWPLSAGEVKALLPCILGRLCHSILMANRAYRAQPDNSYILVSQQGVRRLLAVLDAQDAKQIAETFLRAIHS